MYIFTYLIIKKRVQIFLLHSLQHLQSYLLLLICCLYPNIPSIKKIKAIKLSNITKINIIILVLLFFPCLHPHLLLSILLKYQINC